MDTYSLLRAFADSWVLLAMLCFFLGVAVWAFLPSQASAREDARMIPFRNDPPPGVRAEPCKKNCPDCACKDLVQRLKGIGHE